MTTRERISDQEVLRVATKIYLENIPFNETLHRYRKQTGHRITATRLSRLLSKDELRRAEEDVNRFRRDNTPPLTLSAKHRLKAIINDYWRLALLLTVTALVTFGLTEVF